MVQSTLGRRLLLPLLLLAASGMIAFVIVQAPNQPVVLPDGSLLKLEGISYDTNLFIRGTVAQKLFRRWIPPTGLKLGQWKLMPPETNRIAHPLGPALNIWMSIQSGGSNVVPTLDSRLGDVRLVAIDADSMERRFENMNSFLALTSDRKSLVPSQQVPASFPVSLTAYPRDKRKFNFQILSRTVEGKWNLVAEFEVRNPVRAVPASWTGAPAPIHKVVRRLEFVLDAARLRPGTGTERVPVAKADFRLNVMTEATNRLGWSLNKCVIRDRLGNFHGPLMQQQQGSSFAWSANALASNEVWKIEATVERRGHFLPGQITALNGILLDGTTQSITNEDGRVFEAVYRNPNLELALVNPPPNLQSHFMGATSDGRKVAVVANSLGSGKMSLLIPATNVTGAVEVKLALEEPVSVDFLVQPSGN